MAGKALPKGTKNLTVNLDEALYEDIRQLAEESGMKISQYVRTILEETKEEQPVYQTHKVSRARPIPAPAGPSKKYRRPGAGDTIPHPHAAE